MSSPEGIRKDAGAFVPNECPPFGSDAYCQLVRDGLLKIALYLSSHDVEGDRLAWCMAERFDKWQSFPGTTKNLKLYEDKPHLALLHAWNDGTRDGLRLLKRWRANGYLPEDEVLSLNWFNDGDPAMASLFVSAYRGQNKKLGYIWRKAVDQLAADQREVVKLFDDHGNLPRVALVLGKPYPKVKYLFERVKYAVLTAAWHQGIRNGIKPEPPPLDPRTCAAHEWRF